MKPKPDKKQFLKLYNIDVEKTGGDEHNNINSMAADGDNMIAPFEISMN